MANIQLKKLVIRLKIAFSPGTLGAAILGGALGTIIYGLGTNHWINGLGFFLLFHLYYTFL